MKRPNPSYLWPIVNDVCVVGARRSNVGLLLVCPIQQPLPATVLFIAGGDGGLESVYSGDGGPWLERLQWRGPAIGPLHQLRRWLRRRRWIPCSTSPSSPMGAVVWANESERGFLPFLFERGFLSFMNETGWAEREGQYIHIILRTMFRAPQDTRTRIHVAAQCTADRRTYCTVYTRMSQVHPSTLVWYYPWLVIYTQF
jgi:hypothetical protein